MLKVMIEEKYLIRGNFQLRGNIGFNFIVYGRH